MADPWELILHHTYAGTPGVIFDLSPTRRSSGKAIDIADNAFHRDGAVPRSGAIAFDSATSMIRVPGSQSWTPMDGLRAEFVCTTSVAREIGTLLDGGTFTVRATGQNTWDCRFLTAGGGSSLSTAGDQPALPASEWITIGFRYDVWGVEITVNDETVLSGPLTAEPLLAPRDVIIGNDHTGHAAIRGRMDELKVWRTTPNFVGSNFTGRPMDEEVARCWAEWGRKLAALLNDDPDCAKAIRSGMQRAHDSILRDVRSIAAPANELHWAVRDYHDRWFDGRLDEIPAVLADITDWMHRGGVHPESNPELVELMNSDCYQWLVESMGPIRCDPAFTDMIGAVGPIP